MSLKCPQASESTVILTQFVLYSFRRPILSIGTMQAGTAIRALKAWPRLAHKFASKDTFIFAHVLSSFPQL